MNQRVGWSVRILYAVAATLTALSCTPAWAQTTGVDQEAVRLLKRMTDFMAGLKAYTVDTQNVLEAVLTTGQKVQFDISASVTLQRPNHLRAQRADQLISQVFYYNGSTLTIYNPRDKFYATVPAPATIDAALDYARDSLDIFAPASDLLYADVYQRLMSGMTTGRVVGKTVIGGVKCDQLSFSAPELDWQIWIADGGKPLPCKFVITTKDVDGWPSYAVLMTNWNLAPTMDDSEFDFAPPQGVKKIDFVKRRSSESAR